MRRGAIILVLGLASLALYGLVGLGGGLAALAERLGLGSAFSAYVLLASGLFLIYGAALALLRRMKVSPWQVACLVLMAASFRVVLLPAPPELSNDIYRYVWDGRVQASGVAPWAYPPEDPALAHLRDEAIYPRINRKDARTIYPPGAQLLFRLIYLVAPDSVVGTKASMVVADLATIGLLVWLLARIGAPLQWVALYAWNPLVVTEVALSGHLEPLYLPALVVAFAAHRQGRRALLGALLGLATLVKLYPALLLAPFYRRGDRRMPLAWASVVAVGYLPYVGLGRKVLGFLPTYLTDRYEEFNQGVRFFARSLAGGGGETFGLAYLGAASLALVALAAFVALRQESSTRAVAQGGLLLGGFYLFFVTPALHPWYLIWLLLLGSLWPSVSLLAASWALTLSYLKYAQEPEVLPLNVRLLEFLPLAALFAGEVLIRSRRKKKTEDRSPVAFEPLPGLRSAGYGESRP